MDSIGPVMVNDDDLTKILALVDQGLNIRIIENGEDYLQQFRQGKFSYPSSLPKHDALVPTSSLFLSLVFCNKYSVFRRRQKRSSEAASNPSCIHYVALRGAWHAKNSSETSRIKRLRGKCCRD